jgi:hypothetical protein
MEEELIFNFEFLRQHGINLLQRLSGNIWTDYNLHDPGVTILEHLCFVFTDLAYRTDFSIQDILANQNGEIPVLINSFFTARNILTINPVSVNDKRKYIIDALPQIANIWMEPVVAGVYKTIIQLNKDYDPEIRIVQGHDVDEQVINTDELKSTVINRLIASRNLCEDFEGITILKPELIEINAGIFIENEVTPEEVLANICVRLERLVTPAIKYATEKDLKTNGLQTEDIYQGPHLQRGIIADEQLRPLKREVDPVEFVKTIISVNGVVNIKNLKLKIGENATENMPFQVREGYYPYMVTKPENITLLRKNSPVEISDSVFRFHYYRIKQLANKDFITALYQKEERAMLHGRWRDLKHYHSIQDFFPVAYGLGKNRLPEDAPVERKAATKQLKGYLLLFEQTLMNYLAQLGNVSNFFSADLQSESTWSTLYFQTAFDLPGVDEIIKLFTRYSAEQADEAKTAFIEWLNETIETDEAYRKKKNQVVDHLLARFNVSVPDLPITKYQKYYGQQINGRIDMRLRWKSALLSQVSEVGYYKFRAFDYTGHEGDSKGYAGFKKNMYSFLYIAPPYEKSLIQSFRNDNFRIVLQPTSGAGETARAEPLIHRVRFNPSDTDVQELIDLNEDELQPGSVFNNQTTAVFSIGTDKSNYRILPDPLQEGTMVLAFKTSAPQSNNRWNIISRHSNHEQAENLMMKLVEHFRKISINSEGFHMVEHILLRPDANDPIYRHVLVDDTGKKIMWQKQLLNVEESRRQVNECLQQVARSGPHPSLNELRELFIDWDTVVEYKNGNNLKYYGSFYGDEATLREVFAMLRSVTEKGIGVDKTFRCIAKQARSFYVDNNFFSNKLSFVFPLWPARFQDAVFKNYAQSFIAKSCPVYVQPHFLWMHIHRMNDFETIYFQWLESLKESNSNTRKRLSEALVQMVANEKYIVRINAEDE